MFKLNLTLTLTVLSISLFCFTTVSTFAQATTLTTGDIAFTGYNSDPTTNTDDFCFVILKSTGINSGTTIYFTDRNWKGGSCGTDNFCSLSDNGAYPENGSHFVWTATSSLSYGTHVKISGNTSSPCATCFVCSSGSASGTVLNLVNTGDQIFALQNGAGSTTTSNGPTGTMLAAIQANVENVLYCTFNAPDWDNCTGASDICSSSNNSNKPGCLTNGTNCLILLDGANAEVDNGVYNCTNARTSTTVGAINAMRTAINTASNWTTNDAAAVTLPPSGCSPLPVTWVHFTVGLNEAGALLEWSTSSERNSSHYEIERSFDAVEWKKAGVVKGAGNKNTLSLYYYQDEFNTEGVKYVYYRIRQVDYDGRFEYTPIRVAGKPEGASGYTAFTFNGNPVSEATYLKTFLPVEGQTHIEITDMRGNMLFSKTFDYTGGYNRFMFNEQVPQIMTKPGVYFVRARIESEERVFKLVVQ